jgi:predicted nucleic acid-binding protein
MTVLVDTGVLYADHDTDATRHDAARGALEAVYDGEFGQPYVTDYVFDEAVTLTRQRTDSHAAVTRLSDRIRGADQYPQVYDLRQISTAVFTDAITVFERFEDQSVSFTDATSIALVERHDLDGILSFDDDFDGLVRRVDPASV